MAVEAKRGCGFRRVGGLYIVGQFISVPCDRLPLPLHACPVCGAGIHFARAMTEINPLELFGKHDRVSANLNTETLPAVKCKDKKRPCFVCDPTSNPAFLMMVGEKHYPTPELFMEEARTMGVSKRIPFKPRKMILGETVLYLAHNKACVVLAPAAQEALDELSHSMGHQVKLVEDGNKHCLGIFSAFIPQKLERICWQSEYTEENIKKNADQGVELVPVPDGDKDHA